MENLCQWFLKYLLTGIVFQFPQSKPAMILHIIAKSSLKMYFLQGTEAQFLSSNLTSKVWQHWNYSGIIDMTPLMLNSEDCNCYPKSDNEVLYRESM